MKYALPITIAAFVWNVSAAQVIASDKDSKACYDGNSAASKRWRDRACKDGNPAACDYDEAQKRKDGFEWCEQRYRDNAAAYRWCVNGSPYR